MQINHYITTLSRVFKSEKGYDDVILFNIFVSFIQHISA